MSGVKDNEKWWDPWIISAIGTKISPENESQRV